MSHTHDEMMARSLELAKLQQAYRELQLLAIQQITEGKFDDAAQTVEKLKKFSWS